MIRRRWITGDALKTVIALGGVRTGDEIKLRFPTKDGIGRGYPPAHREKQAKIPRVVMGIDKPLRDDVPIEVNLCWCDYGDITAWRPRKTK